MRFLQEHTLSISFFRKMKMQQEEEIEDLTFILVFLWNFLETHYSANKMVKIHKW